MNIYVLNIYQLLTKVIMLINDCLVTNTLKKKSFYFSLKGSSNTALLCSLITRGFSLIFDKVFGFLNESKIKKN